MEEQSGKVKHHKTRQRNLAWDTRLVQVDRLHPFHLTCTGYVEGISNTQKHPKTSVEI